MTWWRNELRKHKQDLMELVAEVVLFKSGELTLGRSPSGKLIFTGEGNGLENVLDAALA